MYARATASGYSVVVMCVQRQGWPLAARWGGGRRRRRDCWCV